MSKDCNVIYEFLSEEGFRPKIDDDGDIVFKVSGDTYLICFREQDPDYISVRKYFSLDEDHDLTIYRLANKITAQYVVGKCTIVDMNGDTLLLEIDSLEELDSFKKNFERYLQIIQEMEADFGKGMQELAECPPQTM